jgi:hypothetical protein
MAEATRGATVLPGRQARAYDTMLRFARRFSVLREDFKNVGVIRSLDCSRSDAACCRPMSPACSTPRWSDRHGDHHAAARGVESAGGAAAGDRPRLSVDGDDLRPDEPVFSVTIALQRTYKGIFGRTMIGIENWVCNQSLIEYSPTSRYRDRLS